MATIVSHAASEFADCAFNQATLHPDDPIKCRPSTQRTQVPEGEIQSDKRTQTLTR
jgi:hypothetical protein